MKFLLTILTLVSITPLARTDEYSKDDARDLEISTAVKWADAVLRIQVVTPSGGELLRGTGFFINKNGDFLMPHHLYESLGKENILKVTNRHSEKIETVSMLNCMEKKDGNLCLMNAKNTKVLEYFSPKETDYWGAVKQGTTPVSARFFGQCKSYDYRKFRVYHAEGESLTRLFKHKKMYFEKGKRAYYNEGEVLLLQDNKFCDGDEGGPILSEKGSLLGIMSNIFRLSDCQGCEMSKYIPVATPVTKIRKILMGKFSKQPVRTIRN